MGSIDNSMKFGPMGQRPYDYFVDFIINKCSFSGVINRQQRFIEPISFVSVAVELPLAMAYEIKH